MTAPLHIAVLMGGWSSERDVSLMSGNGVADALESLGHRVTRIDMDRHVAQAIAAAAPDVVFNALHGTPGEDGTVQGMLDLVRQRGEKVVPLCGFVRRFIALNPGYADLVK